MMYKKGLVTKALLAMEITFEFIWNMLRSHWRVESGIVAFWKDISKISLWMPGRK